MNQEQQKISAVQAALQFIEPGTVIGVGSGSTVNHFIKALQSVKGKIEGAVAASVESTRLLKAIGIPVLDPNSITEIPVYVDGADEINSFRQMIKGGGGALLREKVVASMSKKFICIADQSKQVDLLGKFPVAVEVIPMARSFVAREIVKLGGDPSYRIGFMTDNGNVILDVHNFKILHPAELETRLNNIAGVVANGIFAARTADMLLLGTDNGVKTIS